MSGIAAPPTFRRQMPPPSARYAMGAFMYGVVHPILWSLDRLGVAAGVLGPLFARQRRQMSAQNPLGSYRPSSHDVFVATFVKSGTNWMLQIAQQLLFHGEAEFDHIHSVVPWPDAELMGPMRGYAIPIDDDSVWRTSPEGKRIIKTHFGWDGVPYSADARYIVVIRDPKDVFVSSYHFLVRSGFLRGLSVDSWLDLFLSDGFIFQGSWAKNTAAFWAQRHLPNVLICSFREMRRDLRSTVRQVATFMDVRVPEAVIDRVCEKSSFTYMKDADEQFRPWKLVPWGPDPYMVRQGAHGASSELLSAAQQRRIDEHCRRELADLGSDFPYDEFCDRA